MKTMTVASKEANTMNKEEKTLGMGVGFVKTRMATWKVQKILESMEEILDTIDVELVDVIVDRSGSRDIDRAAIDDIYDWLDEAPIHVLIVDCLTDITDDEDDFESFIQDMNKRNIIIICMHGNKIIMPSSARVNEDNEE